MRKHGRSLVWPVSQRFPAMNSEEKESCLAKLQVEGWQSKEPVQCSCTGVRYKIAVLDR